MRGSLNGVASFLELVVAASTRDVELLSNAVAASDFKERATAEFQQARDAISTQRKVLANVAQLKLSIKSLIDNVTFYQPRENELKKELAAAINDSNKPTQLVDDIRDEVFELRKRLGARDAANWSIVEDSCASSGSSPRDLVGGFWADPKTSMAEVFHAGSISSQFHVDTSIDGITVRFSDVVASDECERYAKGGDVADPPTDSEVHSVVISFSSPPSFVNCSSFLVFVIPCCLETYYSLRRCFDVRQLSVFCLKSQDFMAGSVV